MRGTVQFIDKTSGQPVSKFNYDLPPKSGSRLTTPGTAATTADGSIWIQSSGNAPVPVAQAVFTYQSGGNVISESGMASMMPTSSVQTYVELSPTGPAQSGVAISNASATAENVNLQLGNLQATITIPPGGQYTGFLNQIPGFQNLPSPQQGIMQVSTADGSSSIAVSALRVRYNEIGQFLLSTVPLIPATPLPSGAELIIPQIVDGGGFTTTFILLNTSSTSSNVLLSTMSPTGQPLTLIK
jgi:hypothetical protein